MQITVQFQRFNQSTKGNRFSVAGLIQVKAEVIRENVPVGRTTGKLVRILEKGAGYPVGHEIVVADKDCL